MNVVFMVLSQFTLFMNGFNLDMSLIKQMYTTDGRDESNEPAFSDSKDLMKHRLDAKEPFLMSFKNYASAWFATGCLCFCFKQRRCYKKRAKMLERFYELRSRLNHEIDMLEVVRVMREAHLVSQVVLHKMHRYFIPSFKNYNLNKEDVDRSVHIKARALKQYSTDVLMQQFRPEDRLVDNIILHSIMGV